MSKGSKGFLHHDHEFFKNWDTPSDYNCNSDEGSSQTCENCGHNYGRHW